MNTDLSTNRPLPLFFQNWEMKNVGELVLLVTIIPIVLWLHV